MAKKKYPYKDQYIKALRYVASYHATNKDSMAKLKKEWQAYRQSYRERYGKPAPSVYQAARAFVEKAPKEKESTPTIDFGTAYLQSFLDRLERIYKDTITYIDNNQEGKHEDGKLASIASYHYDDLSRSYYNILTEIRRYIDSGVPTEVLGQAIADNVELDYTIAVALQPPSDLLYLFDETYEQLQGIWSQINAKLSELAQVAEDEYYGR